ncbi:MAG: hypothetical protein H6R15_354 [Proteobacteria bacterium]|nr:hypothetical protein [Pseudomonadota bacterium]
MDSKLVFVKTPVGDEAVRQSTRVVQRNLRMVLLQVDGKLSVAELSAKIGNARLVEGALRELEEGGFIALRQAAVLGREAKRGATITEAESAISQFSTFGLPPSGAPVQQESASMLSQFSSFGKPILPASGFPSQPPAAPLRKNEGLREAKEAPGQARRFPSMRWLFGVPLGLMLFLLVLVAVYPYANLKPGIEAAATRLLQSPVRVGGVGVVFWPGPQLLLSDLEIGDDGGAVIEQVRVASPLALLTSGRHVLSEVDVVGATLSADFLAASSLFQVPPSAMGGLLAIHQLRFERLTVTVRDLALRDLAGEIVFTSEGGVEKAAFQSFDHGIRLRAMPASGGIQLDVEGFGWKPLGPVLGFDSLQAKALLQKGKLLVQSFDTTFLNGILKGSWLLDWSKEGLVMAGDATLQRLDCRKVTAAFVPLLKLEGELSGSLRLRARGKDWENLWSNVEAHLEADVARGILHGVDLGEVVRRGAGYVVSSGSTKFDRLRSSLMIDSRQVVGRDIQMSAGMVSASGQFVGARERPLEANLLVMMQTSVSTVRTPVRVSGTLPNLSAVSGK